MMSTQNLAFELERSVAQGDVDSAKQNAEALVESKSKVIINIAPQPKNFQDFRLRICIENKHCLDACLYIKVKRSSSVLKLKESIQEKFGFPINVQRWIFEQRVLGNEEILNDLGEVNLLYLYLICEF